MSQKYPQYSPVIFLAIKPESHMGYAGQGMGELISDGIKWLTGRNIWVPDPVVAPIPAPIPVFIPVP